MFPNSLGSGTKSRVASQTQSFGWTFAGSLHIKACQHPLTQRQDMMRHMMVRRPHLDEQASLGFLTEHTRHHVALKSPRDSKGTIHCSRDPEYSESCTIEKRGPFLRGDPYCLNHGGSLTNFDDMVCAKAHEASIQQVHRPWLPHARVAEDV